MFWHNVRGGVGSSWPEMVRVGGTELDANDIKIVSKAFDKDQGF